MQRTPDNRHKDGFTVPELIIAIAIASIVIIGTLVLLIGFANTGSTVMHSVDQVRNSQSALTTIQNDTHSAERFLAVSTANDPSQADSPRSDNTWNHAGQDATHRMLILAIAATTKPLQDPTKSIVYNQTGGCPMSHTPIYFNVVYYIGSDNALYRRVIVPTADTPCAGQTIYQHNTCLAPGTPATCTEKDTRILDNVSSFTIDYYASPDDSTPLSTTLTYNNPAPDPSPPDPNQAMQNVLDTSATTKVTITSSTTIDGKQNSYTSSLRLIRANINA